MLLYIALASIAVMLISLAGVLFSWYKLGAFIEKHLGYLVSFAAGVFLYIAYSLSVEVFHHSETVLDGALWIVLGALGVLVFFKFLPFFHHHHDELEETPHRHERLDIRRILVSDGLHNIGDGILIAASFSISPAIGVVATVSVLIHEFVQEVSEFFVLRQAGYSVKKALRINFAVSSTILIGALGAFFLLEQFEMLEVPLIAIAAGSFFIVVVHDLIPHSIRASENKTHYVRHLAWFALGVVLMLMVGTFYGHGDMHGDHGHDEEHHDDTEHAHDDHDHEYDEHE